MNANLLRSGERVYHPMYGFGVIEGVIVRDQAGQATDFYGIRLTDGAMLSVPVARAESLGLRPIVNSLASIIACLRSPPQALPDNDRQRIVELKARWQSRQPMSLAQAVRDLLGRSRTHHLTPADKKWLHNACERLSIEASLVDAIDLAEARAAVQRAVAQIRSDKPAPH